MTGSLGNTLAASVGMDPAALVALQGAMGTAMGVMGDQTYMALMGEIMKQQGVTWWDSAFTASLTQSSATLKGLLDVAGAGRIQFKARHPVTILHNTSSDHSLAVYFTDVVRAQFLARRSAGGNAGGGNGVKDGTGGKDGNNGKGGAEGDAGAGTANTASFMVHNYPLPLVLSEAATIRMCVRVKVHIPCSVCVCIVIRMCVRVRVVHMR